MSKYRGRRGKDRKKKTKEDRQRKGNVSSGLVFTRIESPFRGVPHEKVVESFQKAGESYEETFRSSLSKLREALSSVDLTSLLSALSVHGLFVGLGEEVGEKDPRTSIGQSEVEIAQAFALAVPPTEISYYPLTPPKTQEIWDLLISLRESFAFKRFAQVNSAHTEQERAILELQERLRLHTQSVRNWGYFLQVVSITKELYAPLNEYYTACVGLSATEIIDVFAHLVSKSESRVNEHINRLRPALGANTIEDAVGAYYKGFPDLKGQPSDFVRILRDYNASLKSVKALIISHADLRLGEAFVFSVDDLSRETGIRSDVLAGGLANFGLRFGDLRCYDPERFFLDNPVWTRPLIILADRRYFSAIPQVFFSFVFPALDGLLGNDTEAKRALQQRRADFLESAIADTFQKAFSDARVGRNFKWKDRGAEYETDLLARVDSYLFIVEVKSGTVTGPALRGAPARAKRHIEELLLEPARQSQRLAEVLNRVISGELEHSAIASHWPFSIAGIREILRLSVTLEDFATVQANMQLLSGTGWIPDDLELVATMCLSDLQVVFEILGSAPEKIHYLVRRTELQRTLHFIADEMNLLALYLETGFNLGEAESEKGRLLITDGSRPIDSYYILKDAGIVSPKPALKITQWWSDIRAKIESRHFDRWSEAAVMLLNISFEEQQALENRFKRTARNVRKQWRQPGHENCVVLTPPAWRRDSFGLLAFKNCRSRERHAMMENVAAGVFAKSHVRRCLVIAINIDTQTYPYSMLAVFERGEG